MFELSLHILDLVQNAISAGATLVRITLRYAGDMLTIEIADDGCGMDEALRNRAMSPFGTTRKTRKVGLGIPMFRQLALACGGAFTLESTVGVGTTLTATFERGHIDLPPVGDLAGTMCTLLLGAPEKPEFVLEYGVDGRTFIFDTREIRAAVGGMPLNDPDILAFVGRYLKEGFAETDEAI